MKRALPQESDQHVLVSETSQGEERPLPRPPFAATVATREMMLLRQDLAATLLELSQDAIIIRDADDRITFWNRGAQEVYGWTADEALSRRVNELLVTDPEAWAALKSQLEQTDSWDGQLLQERKDGSPILIHCREVLVRGADGSRAAVLAIKRDIEQVCERLRKREPDILDIRVELYLTTPGYEISKSEPLVKIMEIAHKAVFKSPVPYAKPIRYGITSDGSRIAQYGVPAITYGPGFGTHLVDPTETKAGEEWDSPTGVRRGVGISNMVNCTKVYAMAALDICNRRKEEVAKS